MMKVCKEREKDDIVAGKQEAFMVVKTVRSKIKVTAGHNIIQP
jgi:hypothetical protein